jgi:hypothetical protein
MHRQILSLIVLLFTFGVLNLFAMERSQEYSFDEYSCFEQSDEFSGSEFYWQRVEEVLLKGREDFKQNQKLIPDFLSSLTSSKYAKEHEIKFNQNRIGREGMGTTFILKGAQAFQTNKPVGSPPLWVCMRANSDPQIVQFTSSQLKWVNKNKAK